MRELFIQTITNAAVLAGLPAGRVFAKSASDNLTIPRPRIEYEFRQERYARTGRKLGAMRKNGQLVRKTELYQAEQALALDIYAESDAWLRAFCRAFLLALVDGCNDQSGNWVRIRIQESAFSTDPEKRVGEQAIRVFSKVQTEFMINFTYRVTREKTENLIPSVCINTPNRG